MRFNTETTQSYKAKKTKSSFESAKGRPSKSPTDLCQSNLIRFMEEQRQLTQHTNQRRLTEPDEGVTAKKQDNCACFLNRNRRKAIYLQIVRREDIGVTRKFSQA
jgi:hypothetical protein